MSLYTEEQRKKLREREERKNNREVGRAHRLAGLQPTAKQAIVLIRMWKTGRFGPLIDYCRRHGIDPTKTVWSTSNKKPK